MMVRRSISSRGGVALLALVLLSVANLTTARAAGVLELIDREVAALYEKSKDAIVQVHAQRLVSAGNLPLVPAHSVSTGFFIDGEGRLLTADSLVQDAESCWIDWHGEKIPAKILGRDPQTKIAMLKVDPEKCNGPGHPMPALRQGDSDALRVGSMVIAIGFPYEMPSAPAVGYVTGVDIAHGGQAFATSHIRAACHVSPGQGGGPLLNVRGEVIGVVVATAQDDQCYALPINATRKVCADILAYGAPRHGWVGVQIGELPAGPDTVPKRGQVFIQQVMPNTPAAEAGFRERDVILKINNKDVRHTADVLNTIFSYCSGDRVAFTIQRDDKEQQITVVVGERPPQQVLINQQFGPQFRFNGNFNGNGIQIGPGGVIQVQPARGGNGE